MSGTPLLSPRLSPRGSLGRFSIKAERSSLKGRYFVCQESLEEVMALVDFPVYGLPEEVFGPHASGYWTPRHLGIWLSRDRFITLDYRSERYVPFLHEQVRKKPTFSVCSSKGLSTPLLGIKSVSYVHWEEGPDMPVQDADRMLVFSSSLTIDGEQFMGNVLSYPAPFFYSMYWFYHGDFRLNGQARGPHPDELIQMLQSLHVLNGKAAE